MTRGLQTITVTLMLLATACSAGGPAEVSLERLTQEQESFINRDVLTEGLVVRFPDDEGSVYVIEDEQQNRVALLPGRKAAPYTGRWVSVAGKFVFDPDIGRVIRVERIEEKGQ